MFALTLRQIVRSFWKYKGFSLINLLGLSIGIAAVLLIFLIADYEKSFEQFHAGVNNIYRVVKKSEVDGKQDYEANVPYPTARALHTAAPGTKATEIHFSKEASIRIGTASPFMEKVVVFADSQFFDVFDFSGIKKFQFTGDPVKALSEPNKVVLTESTAKRYFGDVDPIGKIIKLDAKLELEVAAIVKDIPVTTHLPFNMLVSYASLTKDFIGGFDLNSWTFSGGGYCYVRLDEKNSKQAIEQTLRSIVQNNFKSEREKRKTYYLQPLSAIHFDPAFETSNPSYTISPKYLNMLLLLGCFIILIACSNYINLSTSLAFTKAKEVGIRKTIGASRLQLFSFYLSETLLLATLAAVGGFLLAYLFLPVVNNLMEKAISFHQLANLRFITGAIAALLLVSFISGVYPALILSGFKPIESLKSHLATPGKSSTLLRKGLVVFQFTTSIGLIICTIVIAKQMQYFNAKSLGFDKDAVLEVPLPSPDSTRIQALKSELQNLAGIQQFSFCLGAPISDNGISTSLKAPELPEKGDYNVKILTCDKNYLQTYGIKLMAGRWFLQGEEKKLGSGIVVNETFVKTLGYRKPDEALGKKVEIGINGYTPVIIGVLQDFHTASLHEAIVPVALLPFPYFYYSAGIRIAPGNLRNALAGIEAAYKRVYPEYVYSVNFIDDQLAELYKQDTRNYSLFKAFSVISIFICCIGLWGLIAFVVVRKTKEIGIRKVLGATVTNIVGLLSKDFLLLVVAGLLLACPLAWYFMQQWLQNFAYRINIQWWMFALAGMSVVVIAFVTISFQAIKAAIANPVKNLRTE